MSVLRRLFGQGEPREAASELAQARAALAAEQAENQKLWDAFAASSERVRKAAQRLSRAREDVLVQVEQYARDRDGGSAGDREDGLHCEAAPARASEGGIAQTPSAEPLPKDNPNASS